MTWRRTRSVMAVILTVILAVVAVVAWRWWHNHPPYGPEALAVKSSLSFVSYEEAQAALGEEADAPLASGRDQLVFGRIFWEAPPKPLDGGYFAIFLIDKRTKHKPGTFGVSAPGGERAVSVGSAGVENKIAQRYPWMEGAGYIKVGETGGRTNGNRLGVADEKASPLTFVARFPYLENPGREPSIATAPVAMSDLLLALAYMGPDGQVYWAQRLQG